MKKQLRKFIETWQYQRAVIYLDSCCACVNAKIPDFINAEIASVNSIEKPVARFFFFSGATKMLNILI